MYLGSAEYIDMARVEGGILYAERYLSASIEYFMASMELTTCNITSVTDQITHVSYLRTSKERQAVLWYR
jgi:hypothetical protein